MTHNHFEIFMGNC